MVVKDEGFGLDSVYVAAYADELDAIAMMHFPFSPVDGPELVERARLLTVNTYADLEGDRPEADLVLGEGHYGRYGNFSPWIAEYMSDDRKQIEARKSEIEESEWQRCEELGRTYLAEHGLKARDGSPLRAWIPADFDEIDE